MAHDNTHGSHAGHGHGHSHASAHAAGHHGHDVSKEVRKYMIVFGALMIGTILTVAVSYVDFGSHAVNIGVGLLIATVKAALVAAYFMHLIDERKMVYGVLGATVFFFVGLMYLTLWSSAPGSFIHFKQ
jgi:cytochrome c oxidase subunit IV